jgi:hypothetical protein
MWNAPRGRLRVIMRHIMDDHEPSPEEIESACQAIRRGWSQREHYRRRVHMPSGGCIPLVRQAAGPMWSVPTVHVTREIATADKLVH